VKHKILIVLAKFYGDLSKNLIFGAKEKLKGKANVKIIEVPGSFNICFSFKFYFCKKT
jgi:6,7-dimethyl-8-ribityllumazine synthase